LVTTALLLVNRITIVYRSLHDSLPRLTYGTGDTVDKSPFSGWQVSRHSESAASSLDRSRGSPPVGCLGGVGLLSFRLNIRINRKIFLIIIPLRI